MEHKILTPEQIKQVKGLGALQDKRYTDVFNVRTITRNGRVTTDEIRAIAEAADKFGSGKVAMRQSSPRFCAKTVCVFPTISR